MDRTEKSETGSVHDGAQRAALLRQRWDALPPAARTSNQLAGRVAVACGATHGLMERCDLACTSCYLTRFANATRPLAFDEARRQLDTLRRELGEGGKVQLTSGEVTLLPVDELGRLVAHARAIGLEPMVMTNGERLRREPDYLEQLVSRYGLRRISVHVDTTQRGRDAPWQHVAGRTEAELHPLRAEFAGLVRTVRRRGARLHAATTVTVTHDNLAQVDAVVDFALDHADAFRIVSLQPSAAVGRTRHGDAVRTPADTIAGDARARDPDDDDPVHAAIREAIGRPVATTVVRFGHPACNTLVPLLVVRDPGRPGRAGRHVVELARRVRRDDQRIVERWIGAADEFGSDTDPRPVLDRGVGRAVIALVARLARRPWMCVATLCWLGRRVLGERPAWRIAFGALLRGRRVRIDPLLIVVHRFMAADELTTPLGRERLAACVFKVPVDGRLVSMCELNATGMRERLDRALVTPRGARSDER